jgi:hypothetical protein
VLIALAARVAAASGSGDVDGVADDDSEAGERDDADSGGRRAGRAEPDMELSANAAAAESDASEPGEGERAGDASEPSEPGEGERAGDAGEPREPGEADSGADELGEVAEVTAMPAGRELSFSSAAGLAGTGELTDPEPSPARSSRWGRFDLSVAWRRTLATPAMGPAARADELWLLASWSR